MLKDETLSHKLISKWFWLYLFLILGLPLGYFIRILLSNSLSVSEIGIIYWLLGLMWLLSSLSSLWLSGWSLVYFLPKYMLEKKENHVNTIYKIIRYINIFMTIIVCIWLYFFIQYFWNSYIEHPDVKNILYIFLAYFFFSNLANPVHWIYQTFQDVFTPQLTWFISQAFISISIIILFYLWIWSIVGYSIIFLIWTIISYIILFSVYKIKYSKYIEKWIFIKDKVLIKEMMLFWLNVLIWSNALLIINTVDMQMLMVISWSENAWYYTNYMSLLGILMLFLGPIMWLIFPIISELNSKGQIEKLKLLQDFFYKYIIIFTLSLSILLAVFWEVLSVIFFWENFLYSGSILKYLAFFWVFQIMFSINLSILWWIWKLHITRNILIIAMIINVFLNLILIPTFWALGAWISTVIAWLLIAIFSFYFINKNIRINFDYKFCLKNIFLIMLIWIAYHYTIPHIFILENIYRYTNLIYLLIMWFWAYIILILFNIWEIKYFTKEIKWFLKK